MTDIRTRGFKTKTELDEHLADIEEAAETEEARLLPVDYAAEKQETGELARLQEDLTLLRRHLALLREQAKTSISARAERADASASEQPGNYPWFKLAGVIAVTLLLARRLRSLPPSRMTRMPCPFSFRLSVEVWLMGIKAVPEIGFGHRIPGPVGPFGIDKNDAGFL